MPRAPLSQSQVSQLTSEEFQQLRCYSTILKSVTLNDDNLLTVRTLEDNDYFLRVTSEGWRVVQGGQQSETERAWEMVEDLLRSVSPLFKAGWDALLLEKLQCIARMQGQEGGNEHQSN